LAEDAKERLGHGLRPPTLAAHVTEKLRDAIIQGMLVPGQPLVLSELAKTLDVSAMPVREALKRLQSEGLVEQLPQKEARVAPLSLIDLEDTYAARVLLETRVIQRSAEQFSDTDYARLSRILEQYELAYAQGLDTEGRKLHKAFHFGLYQVGGSAWLLQLISMLWDNSERYRRLSINIRGSVHERRQEHGEILDACRMRDAERAVYLLNQHLRRTADLVYRAAALSLHALAQEEE
jgi:DNA-binding GntR family transcriptional regulator